MSNIPKNIVANLATAIAVIIPFKDQHEYTVKCVRSIFVSAVNPHLVTVYLVDNNSECNETSDAIKQLCQDYLGQITCLSYPHPFNFSAINNYAVRHSEEDYIFFVNNDIEVITPGLLEAGVSALNDEQIGVVGFELLYADGSIQHSGVKLNIRNNPFHELLNNEASRVPAERQLHETLACTGALLGIKRTTFQAIGGFDEELPASYNDIDLCLKVKNKGLRIVVNRMFKSFHYESKTRKLDFVIGEVNLEKKERLMKDRAKLHNNHPKIFKNALINPITHHFKDTGPFRAISDFVPSVEVKTDFQKIFFVSTTRQTNIGLDPSVIYRCINPAKKINASCKHTRCNVISQLKLINSYKSLLNKKINLKDSMMGEFFLSSIVIFHRPTFSMELVKIVEQLKNNGCRIIADYDDYVFDLSDYLNTSAAHKVTKKSEDMQLQYGISRNHAALELFDEFTVSTEPLKSNLAKTLSATSRQSYKIHVIQNTPSSYWFSYAETLFDQAYKENRRNTNTSIIGYFGGTASHSKDFQLVHQWINNFLAKHKKSKFIYCSVAFDQLFSDLVDEQVSSFAPVTYNTLPAIYNLSWLNLAPLSAGPFNQSKSGLKYFESAMFGLPVCATYIPDIQDRFDGLPLLYTLDTLDSIESALENSQSLFHDFSKYLESWEFILTSLKVENDSINQNLLKIMNIY